MKYTTYYSNIEKVEYEFDINDLRDILVSHLTKGKTPYQTGGKWTIEHVDDYKDKNDEFPFSWHIQLTHEIEQAVKKGKDEE